MLPVSISYSLNLCNENMKILGPLERSYVIPLPSHSPQTRENHVSHSLATPRCRREPIGEGTSAAVLNSLHVTYNSARY